MQMVARMMAADDDERQMSRLRRITSTAVCCAAVGGCTGTGFPALGITASAPNSPKKTRFRANKSDKSQQRQPNCNRS